MSPASRSLTGRCAVSMVLFIEHTGLNCWIQGWQSVRSVIRWWNIISSFLERASANSLLAPAIWHALSLNCWKGSTKKRHLSICMRVWSLLYLVLRHATTAVLSHHTFMFFPFHSYTARMITGISAFAAMCSFSC